jgi:hypothetical protein
MNTYKIYLLAFLFTVSTAYKSFAQDIPIEPPQNGNSTSTQYSVGNAAHKDSEIVWRGLYINASVGYDIPSITNEGAGFFLHNASFHVGAEGAYMFAPHIGFVTGVLFRQYSFNYSYTGVIPSYEYTSIPTTYRTTNNDTSLVAGYSTSAKYSFNYIRVPLLIRFITSQENKIGFYVEAGLLADILLNDNVSGTASQIQYSLEQQANTSWYSYSGSKAYAATISEANANVNRFTVALHAAAGFIVPLSAKIFIGADFALDYSVLSAGTGNNDVVNFGSTKYNFYGTGSYGCFNSEIIEAKLIFKLN